MQPKFAAKHTKELSAEQTLQLDQVNLKSLSLCIGMLERVDSVSHYSNSQHFDLYDYVFL